MQLVYMGFEQVENVRQYIFHRVVYGEETREFVVGMDLALFGRNRVGIQEGPTVCLGVLMADLETVEPARQPLARRTLSDQHLQAYLLTRGTTGARGAQARGRFPKHPPGTSGPHR